MPYSYDDELVSALGEWIQSTSEPSKTQLYSVKSTMRAWPTYRNGTYICGIFIRRRQVNRCTVSGYNSTIKQLRVLDRLEVAETSGAISQFRDVTQERMPKERATLGFTSTLRLTPVVWPVARSPLSFLHITISPQSGSFVLGIFILVSRAKMPWRMETDWFWVVELWAYFTASRPRPTNNVDSRVDIVQRHSILGILDELQGWSRIDISWISVCQHQSLRVKMLSYDEIISMTYLLLWSAM